MSTDLTDRERQVLEAVIQTYVETAEPTGSRTIAKRYQLGISAATIRNTMSDLEDRGYLYHPHTSAGRIPTDLAYRVYVDRLMAPSEITESEEHTLRRELRSGHNAIEDILSKAAEVLGVLTQELGVAVAPSFDGAILDKLELLQVSADRLLMVLVLRNGAARTIFVEASSALPSEAVAKVSAVLNERLTGLTLHEIRTTLRERLRDMATAVGEQGLLNIFVEEADHIFDVTPADGKGVVLGSTQMLASQPEFSSKQRMRTLLEITERRDLLQDAILATEDRGLRVTIGGENPDPKLNSFTLVTSTYQYKGVSGVIGVMGPTRMPYKKIIVLVEHTSRLVGGLLR
jgi:heat-inducible transcriptional repressor